MLVGYMYAPEHPPQKIGSAVSWGLHRIQYGVIIFDPLRGLAVIPKGSLDGLKKQPETLSKKLKIYSSAIYILRLKPRQPSSSEVFYLIHS